MLRDEEELLEQDPFAGTVWTKIYERTREFVRSLHEAIREVRGDLEELVEEVRKRKARIPNSSRKYVVAVVDSTYTPMAIDTYVSRIAGVVYGYLIYPSRRRPEISVEIVDLRSPSEGRAPESSVSRAATILEIAALLSLLERRESERGLSFDVVVRDGDFPPAEAIYLRSSRTGYVRRARELSRRVLREASSLGVGVAGIVKRISSSLIAFKLLGERVFEEREKRRMGFFSDAFVARIALRPGEYLELGKYGEDFGGEPLISSYFSKLMRRKIDEILDECPEFGEIEIAYYRPPFPSSPVVKVLAFNVDVEDFVAYCSSVSTTSYPQFLNLIDKAVLEYARGVNIESLLYLALQKAAEELAGEALGGETLGFALGALNRQKVEVLLRWLKRD